VDKSSQQRFVDKSSQQSQKKDLCSELPWNDVRVIVSPTSLSAMNDYTH